MVSAIAKQRIEVELSDKEAITCFEKVAKSLFGVSQNLLLLDGEWGFINHAGPWTDFIKVREATPEEIKVMEAISIVYSKMEKSNG